MLQASRLVKHMFGRMNHLHGNRNFPNTMNSHGFVANKRGISGTSAFGAAFVGGIVAAYPLFFGIGYIVNQISKCFGKSTIESFEIDINDKFFGVYGSHILRARNGDANKKDVFGCEAQTSDLKDWSKLHHESMYSSFKFNKNGIKGLKNVNLENISKIKFDIDIVTIPDANKINDTLKTNFITIGATNNDKYYWNDKYWDTNNAVDSHNYYAYSSAGYKQQAKSNWCPYGEKFYIGDTIRMEINFDDNTISYFKNGKNMGYAFEDINKNDDYQLAIGVFAGSSVSVETCIVEYRK